MKKVYSGYLTVDDYHFLCLSPDDGYINLGNSLASLVSADFAIGSKVFVRYFITDSEASEESVNETLIHKTFGYDNIEANYALEAYSEVTIELWEEDLKIGGHDLISELTTYSGKYLILIIEEFNSESPYGDCL